MNEYRSLTDGLSRAVKPGSGCHQVGRRKDPELVFGGCDEQGAGRAGSSSSTIECALRAPWRSAVRTRPASRMCRRPPSRRLPCAPAAWRLCGDVKGKDRRQGSALRNASRDQTPRLVAFLLRPRPVVCCCSREREATEIGREATWRDCEMGEAEHTSTDLPDWIVYPGE